METEIRLWLKWVGHLLYASSFQNLVYEYEIEVPVVALMQAAARHVSQWCVFSVFHHCTTRNELNRVQDEQAQRPLSLVGGRSENERKDDPTYGSHPTSAPNGRTTGYGTQQLCIYFYLFIYLNRDYIEVRLAVADEVPTDALSLEVFESLLELIKQRGVTAITPVHPGTAAHGPWARYESRIETQNQLKPYLTHRIHDRSALRHQV